MKPRKIISNDIEKMKEGFIEAVRLVGMTYGPGGSDASLERMAQNSNLITNDGVTVGKNIYFDDEIMDHGAAFVRDMTYEADQGSGDGTTTTAVLAGGLLEEYWPQLYSKTISLTNAKQFSNGLKKIEDDVCNALDAMTKPAKTKKDLVNIATVSVEDKEIGEIIGNMFHEVGTHGHVEVEHSYGFDIKTRVINSFNLDSGMVNHNFSTGKYMTQLEQASVVLFDNTMNIQDLQKLFLKLGKQETIKQLVLLAHDFSDDVIENLGYIFSVSSFFKKEKALMPIVPIKLPVTYREIILRDLSAMTGSEVVTSFSDYSISKVGLPFHKILIKKNKTYFMKPPKDITEYVKDLEEQMKEMSAADKDRMKKRIARITGSTGVIMVGGQTDAERNYLYHKIKDAVNATALARDFGYVPGGGIALKKISAELGLPGFSVPHAVLSQNLGDDFVESKDIIDSVEVVKNSVRKAMSAVRRFINTKIIIANKRLTVEEEYNLMMRS